MEDERRVDGSGLSIIGSMGIKTAFHTQSVEKCYTSTTELTLHYLSIKLITH